MKSIQLSIWLLCAFATGCSGAALRPAPKPVAGEGFVLALAAPADLKAGVAFEASLVVTPKAPFHVTMNYPVEVVFQGEGLQPTEAAVAADGLVAYTADRLEATAKFVAPTGARTLLANARFSLCTESACHPVDVTHQIEIHVE